MGMRSPLVRQDPQDPETDIPTDPPSPSSYVLPLLLVIVLCGGFLTWRWRQKRRSSSSGSNFDPAPTAVRLSTEDVPAAHSFLVNNASTDSLPSHALADMPTFTELSRGPSPQPGSDSRYGGAGMRAPPARSQGKGKGKEKQEVLPNRRSARLVGPIEGDDEDSDESRQEGGGSGRHRGRGSDRPGQIFGIGDEEDDEDLNEGPLRTKT